jgi:hypothetical protein
LDPAFQSNVEKAIGTTVPGSSIVPRFALGFTGSLSSLRESNNKGFKPLVYQKGK